MPRGAYHFMYWCRPAHEQAAWFKRNVPAENKQSGNCLHCHASVMPLYAKLGKEAAPNATPAEQLQAGLVKVGELDYWKAHKMLGELSGVRPHCFRAPAGLRAHGLPELSTSITAATSIGSSPYL